MSMLEKILAEHEGMKSVIPVKVRQEEEKKEEPEVSIGKLNYDNEVDLDTAEILVHKFVAPEEDNKVSKAKDANLREESEDWYDITDPRNKINQRRRGVFIRPQLIIASSCVNGIKPNKRYAFAGPHSPLAHSGNGTIITFNFSQIICKF
uniref:Uncharacterized protein n=1 Tax=Wuchereria bancrofti TaxID=6293 RepID=A0A1I8EJF0_WUCBA